MAKSEYIGDSQAIIPIISAVHPNPIYSSCITKNSKWLFTGSQDGFVRKYNVIDSLNGVQVLTGAQRHGLADSIQKGGSLASAWENYESPIAPAPNLLSNLSPSTASTSIPGTNTTSNIQIAAPVTAEPGTVKTSPVYCLDVHPEGIWCVGGTSAGNVNVWSVRHEEGKVQHVINAHTDTVSSLLIAPGQKSLLTGSWDKTVKLWNLDTGSCISEYNDAKSHITSITCTPETQTPLFLVNSFDGVTLVYDSRKPNGLVTRIPAASSGAPPWSLAACWSNDGGLIYVGRRNSSVDEFDFKMNASHSRTLRLPASSGSVSALSTLPDGKSLLIASYDNIRVWDLENRTADHVIGTPSQTRNSQMDLDHFYRPDILDEPVVVPQKGKKDATAALLELDNDASIPFTLIPGHQGGVISSLYSSGNVIISTSGSVYEGNSTNLCLLYKW